MLESTSSVDPLGQLTLTVTDLKALGAQTSSVLEVLDLKLEDLVDVKNERGIHIDGSVIQPDPLQGIPPRRPSWSSPRRPVGRVTTTRFASPTS